MMTATRRRDRSAALFAAACERIPGGVNSPVRAFANVGISPAFYERALGSRVVDVDGNEYVDFIGSWGPMILGHRPPEVLDAVCAQLERGLSARRARPRCAWRARCASSSPAPRWRAWCRRGPRPP